MNRLRSLEHWDRGSESHSRHGCLCAFILFVFCVYVVALDGLIPPPGPRSPTDCIYIKKLKKKKKPAKVHKGCRAIDTIKVPHVKSSPSPTVFSSNASVWHRRCARDTSPLSHHFRENKQSGKEYSIFFEWVSCDLINFISLDVHFVQRSIESITADKKWAV
jgi:hypothetical protein